MNHISQDLVRTVIEYTPIVALRDLSKASPIMAREICHMGIKVFYYDYHGTRFYVLGKNDIIIKTMNGTRYVLQQGMSEFTNMIWDYKFKRRILELNNGTNNLPDGTRVYVEFYSHVTTVTGKDRYRGRNNIQGRLHCVDLDRGKCITSGTDDYDEYYTYYLVNTFKVIYRYGSWVK